MKKNYDIILKESMDDYIKKMSIDYHIKSLTSNKDFKKKISGKDMIKGGAIALGGVIIGSILYKKLKKMKCKNTCNKIKNQKQKNDCLIKC